MNSCCDNFTDEVKELFKTEHNPELIRSEFANTGYEYGLVIGRNVPVTIPIFLYNEDTLTYSASDREWQKLTLTFDNDRDTSTSVKASFDLDLVDEGAFDPDYIPGSGPTVLPDINASERYQCVFPASELDKLAVYDWVVAELTSDSGDMISRCVFKVLGGQ